MTRFAQKILRQKCAELDFYPEMTSIDFETPGGKYAGLRWGNLDAKTRILCVHSWMDNAAAFSALGKLLSANPSVLVVAMDLAGHGMSVHRPGGTYTDADYVLDIARVVTALGWSTPFYLIGHSVGGGACVSYAAAFPADVAGLVLLDGSGVQQQKLEFTAGLLIGHLQDRIAHEDESRPHATLEDAITARQHFKTRMLKKWKQIVPHDVVRDMVLREFTPLSPYAVKDGGSWVSRADGHLLIEPAFGYTNSQAALFATKLRAPVLIILPNDGIMYSIATDKPQWLEGRINAFPAATTRVISVLGSHYAHADAATVNGVYDAIQAFLQAPNTPQSGPKLTIPNFSSAKSEVESTSTVSTNVTPKIWLTGAVIALAITLAVKLAK